MTSFPFDIEGALAHTLRKRLSKVLPVGCSDLGDSKSQTASRRKDDLAVFDVVTVSHRVERVAARGGSDFDIARSLKVDETTLMIWLNTYTALKDAVGKGRERWLQRLRGLRRPPCPRCGGWVDETIELFGEAFSIVKKVPRCLICGKRFYRTMTPLAPRPSTGRKG